MSTKFVRDRIWGNPPDQGAGSGGGSNAFNGQRAITRNTPGMVGYDPNTTNVVNFLNNVFYPAVPPSASLTVDNPIREIGQTTAYTLSWTATQNTNLITGITVNGIAVTPTGFTQSGTQAGNTANNLAGEFDFSMTDTDGALSGSASCSIKYKGRMFWGTVASNAAPSDATLLALANNALVDNFDLTLTNFGGGGKYLVFAFPSNFGTPSFIVNGLNNTAFTCVRSNSNFVNSQGATVVMDVWTSNNLYNSPLDSVIVK